MDVSEEKIKSEDDPEESSEPKKQGRNGGEAGTGTMDDKVWGEVSQDLGHLLNDIEEPEVNKSSDDEDDSRAGGRRYDRFKHSAKGKSENVEKIEQKLEDDNTAKEEIVNGEEEKEDT